ncbi:MAG TPA: L,D-transpeptidase [Gaiellaceae bacterium]|nr:L,D-transpeptidase [Gaiellaceae bacterium]
MAEVLRKAVPALGAALVVAGCAAGGDEQAREPPGAQPRPLADVEHGSSAAPPPERRCRPARETPVGDEQRSYAARAAGPVTAFARPRGRPVQQFGLENVNGIHTVFGVLAVVRDRGCRPAWYRVQLPIRPNGATGYVRARDVRLLAVRTRIEVDLSARRIDFFRDGRRVLRTTAGVGSDATPTPTGRYYVNQRLVAPDPAGPFGPGAIGISAYSPVLTNWVQGGPIAIHGTNDPSSIGRAVTNGCLRIANRLLVRMYGRNPEGTPVLVRA